MGWARMGWSSLDRWSSMGNMRPDYSDPHNNRSTASSKASSGTGRDMGRSGTSSIRTGYSDPHNNCSTKNSRDSKQGSLHSPHSSPSSPHRSSNK